MPPSTLHVAALDYAAEPGPETSDRLVAASLQATLAEVSATGETTGTMREALLLIGQLADDHLDRPTLPSCDDDDDVGDGTGILRLPPMRQRILHACQAHSSGLTPEDLCELLQATTPGATAQVMIEIRSLTADGLLWRTVHDNRYLAIGAPEDGAP